LAGEERGRGAHGGAQMRGVIARSERERERESERGGECGNSAERGGARVGGRLEQMDVGLALSFCASLWITG
jgi:hypothetical protein